jgi:glycerol-3-phosphate dehydrogenase
MINVSPSGLLTIAGGKWTTYRAMAEETIDKAIEVFGNIYLISDLKPTGPCVTTQTLLVGSHTWSPNMFIKLIQHFGLEPEVAKYLAETYGDQAWTVASLASQSGTSYPLFGKRIAQGYPYIEAEVRHACRHEYACSVVDVLARRTRLMFLNAKASLEAIPRVIEIMSSELGWNKQEKEKQAFEAKNYLLSMGLSIKDQITFPADGVVSNDDYFVPGELERFKKIFNSFDVDHDGHITQKDLAKAFKALDIKFKQEDIQKLIDEVDFDKNGAIEFNEFVQCLAAVKDIKSRKKFERLLADYEDRQVVDPSRSGGGV